MRSPAADAPRGDGLPGGGAIGGGPLGLDPDLPAGRIVVRSMWPPPIRELEARGIRIGGGRLDVRLTAEHGVDLEPVEIDTEIDVVVP